MEYYTFVIAINTYIFIFILVDGNGFSFGEGDWVVWLGSDQRREGIGKTYIYSSRHTKHINKHKPTALREEWGFDW